jgi:uncharacterized membrane protein YczE
VTTTSDDDTDARYAQVLSFPTAAELRRRMPPLVVGLFVLGFAISVSVRARLGVSPWDVLHQGLAHVAHLSFGLVVVLVGLVVLLTWIPLHQRLGLGTVLNTLSVGFIANLGIYLIPEQHRLAVRIPMLLASIVMFGVGGGLYIGSGLGPGPRDGLMTAIASRGHPVWAVRTVLECSALGAGYLLGGHVGVGTVLLAFTIGPVTHAGLRRFHLPVHDDTPEVLGE